MSEETEEEEYWDNYLKYHPEDVCWCGKYHQNDVHPCGDVI